MRDCVILGAGRSGTSLLAGSLAGAGYYMGDYLYQGNAANPKGFFEDPEINGLNEALLAGVTPRKRGGLFAPWHRHRPGGGQRWLARVAPGTPIRCPRWVARRIAEETARTPFCFKDPRFSYTLPAWRPWLRDTVFVCVFREPDRTAASMVKEAREAPYLRNLEIDVPAALEVWRLMYRHILDIHRHQDEWLFIHYDQALDGSGLDRLEAALGAPVDRSFADRALKRSPSGGVVPPATLATYRELCELAGYAVEAVTA
jgi:hypothetical protein